MLISAAEVYQALEYFGTSPAGALHVGAHECEELAFYNGAGIAAPDIVWIEALAEKVNAARARGIPNVYQAVVSDVDGQPVSFRIANNYQSSSILEFGTHSAHHPEVRFEAVRPLETTTLDTFLERNGVDASRCGFWNFDIQGAELLALKGGTRALQHARAVYLEVNTEEVYRGCARVEELDAFLGAHGFTRVLTHMTPFGWGDALYVRAPHPSLITRWRRGAPLRRCRRVLRRWFS